MIKVWKEEKNRLEKNQEKEIRREIELVEQHIYLFPIIEQFIEKNYN